MGGSLDGLITAVENSDLPANRKRPLLASLEAAQASFARGDIGAFANQLRAFENKVQAQVESANAALANRLISLAQEIIERGILMNMPQQEGDVFKQWRSGRSGWGCRRGFRRGGIIECV